MTYAVSRTEVPLEAPNPLPAEQWSVGNGPVQTAPNTAQAEAKARSYDVSLSNCPQALPLNSARFEQSCGFMVTIYGNFGGNSYANPASALSLLSADEKADLRRPAGCMWTRHVRLSGRVEAEVYAVGRTGGNCLAHWGEHGWEFVLTGFFADRDGWGSWPATANQVIAYLTRHKLPAAHGVLYCDIAGDGLPTTLTWAHGDRTYTTAMYHSALGAIDMADAMTPYPGAKGPIS